MYCRVAVDMQFLLLTSVKMLGLVLSYDVCFYFFFFQAEDGIRDLIVTGVQTCALPICRCPQSPRNTPCGHRPEACRGERRWARRAVRRARAAAQTSDRRERHPG